MVIFTQGFDVKIHKRNKKMDQSDQTTDGQTTIEKFLSIAEVREKLGISHSFAYQLIRSGELPAYKLQGRTILKASDVIKMTQGLRRA